MGFTDFYGILFSLSFFAGLCQSDVIFVFYCDHDRSLFGNFREGFSLSCVCLYRV